MVILLDCQFWDLVFKTWTPTWTHYDTIFESVFIQLLSDLSKIKVKTQSLIEFSTLRSKIAKRKFQKKLKIFFLQRMIHFFTDLLMEIMFLTKETFFPFFQPSRVYELSISFHILVWYINLELHVFS